MKFYRGLLKIEKLAKKLKKSEENSPFWVLFELFVRSATSPAPANGEAQNKEESGCHSHEAAYQRLLGQLFSDSHMSFMYLLTMFILQDQHIIFGLVLINTQDVKSGNVAVVGQTLPLLLHRVHIMAGSSHQG